MAIKRTLNTQNRSKPVVCSPPNVPLQNAVAETTESVTFHRCLFPDEPALHLLSPCWKSHTSLVSDD